MKKFLILIYLGLSFVGFAQSNFRLNNNLIKTTYGNPSSINDEYSAIFTIASRKQWLGIEGTPSTFLASASVYNSDLHTQLALNILRDNIGYTSITNMNLSYAHELLFKNNWKLNLGLAADYMSVGYDLGEINLGVNSDNFAYQNLTNSNEINADLGIELTKNQLRLGLFSQNIISNFNKDNTLQINSNFIYAKYRQESNRIVNYGFGVCGIQYADIVQFELNLTSYFKLKKFNGLIDKDDLFDLGLFYRTQSEAGGIFGFNITDNLHISYSYDYHFGGIRYGSYGTNELMISYRIKPKEVCHDCWY